MRLPDDLTAVARAATDLWGSRDQEAVAIGEIGELLALFGKRAQGRATEEQWVDEIADGFIMLAQLAVLHSVVAVETRLTEKLGKLKEKVLKHQQKTAPPAQAPAPLPTPRILSLCPEEWARRVVPKDPRLASLQLLLEERQAYQTDDSEIFGRILFDRGDQDFGFVVHARKAATPSLYYVCVDCAHSFPTEGEAQKALEACMLMQHRKPPEERI